MNAHQLLSGVVNRCISEGSPVIAEQPTFAAKVERLRVLLETQQRARLLAEGCPQEILDNHGEIYQAQVVSGKKYTKLDFGRSGKYMIDNETGEIFGIKGYGVIHRGHRFGTLDTINEWNWSMYRAYRVQS